MFKNIDIKDINFNELTTLRDSWALLSAGNTKSANTMTINWGAFGEIWYKDVFFAFVRPNRYTKKFMDEENYFSVCFFDEKYKEELLYLGRNSGRNDDKVKKVGFNFVFDKNAPYFKEAKYVFILKKEFAQDLKKDSFIDLETYKKAYPKEDLHTMYVGSIVEVLLNE